MATPIRLASTIQPIHETVTNRSANSNSDEDVSNNQDVIERLTRAMKIRRGWRQNDENSDEKSDKIMKTVVRKMTKLWRWRRQDQLRLAYSLKWGYVNSKNLSSDKDDGDNMRAKVMTN